VEELRPGLWTWTAPHPDWVAADGAGPAGWEQDVRSCALVSDRELVVLDPMDVPEPLAELARDRTVSVVLTCAWHSRSAGEYVERFGATVHAPGEGIEALGLPATPYALGANLPGGVVAAGGYYPQEIVLWISAQRTLFAGDAFVAPPLRLQRSWLPKGVTLEQALERLRPLGDLRAETFVVGHGTPVTEGVVEALQRELRG